MFVDPLSSLGAVWVHEGRPADLVRQLKYRGGSAAVTVLADAMAARAPGVDVVTWCPAAPGSRRRRPFDQSELLARAIGHRLGVRVRRLLRRESGDPAQTDRDRFGRLAGPTLSAASPLRGSPRVLLVDDVATTATTLRVGAAALRGAGAGEVHGLVATRARRRRADRSGATGVRSGTQRMTGGSGWTSPSVHGM